MSPLTHLLDFSKAAWVFVTFATIFFWLPSYILPRNPDSAAALRIASNFTRAVLLTTVATVALAGLKILNATTLFLFLAAAVLTVWLRRRSGSSGDWLRGLQAAILGFISSAEKRAVFGEFMRRFDFRAWRTRWLRALHGREFLVVTLLGVLVATAVLQFGSPLAQLRLDHPEQYGSLLRSRELLLNLQPAERPIVFPSIVSTTALFSSTDAMQVTRFLTPALGILVAFATGFALYLCAHGGVACIVAMYCLGTAAFPVFADDGFIPATTFEKVANVFRIAPSTIRSSPEFEMGLLFLLLAIVFLADWHKNQRNWNSLFDVGCCLLLVGIISPFVLFVLVLAAGSVLLWPALGLIVVVVIPFGLASYAAVFPEATVPADVRLLLPLATALAIGCVIAFAEGALLSFVGPPADSVLLLACVVLAVLWFRPHPPAAQYLEYEQSARQTVEIADSFPRQRWIVAAPAEQLAETLGLGGHLDLSEFVDKYQSQAASPKFRFPESRQDLFIYVEKRPFQVFSREPEIVPLPVLTDVTYRAYRSPAGRASLESAALKLCEDYRQTHNDAEVFFEDEDIRIYHVARGFVSNTGRRE